MMSLFEYAKPFGFFLCISDFPVSGSGGVPYLKIVNFQSSDIRRNTEPGLEVIKLEYKLRLKIKRNDWLLADTCPQTANHCALF